MKVNNNHISVFNDNICKHILKKKKHKFNNTYDDDDSFSIHTPNQTKHTTTNKTITENEFIDIAANTDTIAMEARETNDKFL